MVENTLLVGTDAGVIEDLDWGMELLISISISDLTEEVELLCKKLVTWEVSCLEWVLVVQFGNEADKLCNSSSNLAGIASLEVVKTETAESGEEVLFSPMDVTENVKEDTSRYPTESEEVAVDGTS